MTEDAKKAEKMSTRDVMRVAVEADVDERTVRRYLDGELTKPRNKEDIGKAIGRLGLEKYTPARVEPPVVVHVPVPKGTVASGG